MVPIQFLIQQIGLIVMLCFSFYNLFHFGKVVAHSHLWSDSWTAQRANVAIYYANVLMFVFLAHPSVSAIDQALS